MIKYVDVHAHISEKIFDKDREKILKECEKRGILIINCGGDKNENRRSIKLLKYKNVRICLGIYPTEACEMSNLEFFKELEFIKKNLKYIIGIGEVGLDFYWIKDEEKINLEIERFKEMIWFANKNKIPLNVHSRKAERETIEILSKMANVPVVLHAFGGGVDLAKIGASHGFYFSIPPIVVRSKKYQKLVRHLPIQKLLTETDAPYLGPEKGRNDPMNVLLVIKKIAEIKGMSEEDVRLKILENFKKVFKV